MNRKIIIGDIHGCYKTLIALLHKLDLKDDYSEIVLVGDIIDRGPSSKTIIDFVRSNNIDCVMGNHEEMMIDSDGKSFDDNLVKTEWGYNGGDIVEREYGMDRKSLESDIEFLSNLPKYIIYDDLVDNKNRKLIVTHASISDQLDLYFKSKDILTDENITEFDFIGHSSMTENIERLMMWNRNIPKKGHQKYFNIFGHTPIDSFIFDKYNEWLIKDKYLTAEKVVINKKIGYANIDTGAVYTKKKHGKYRGKLTAIEFPSLKIFQQENIDDCESY